jgi:2-iminobutanoate/2-iminopropanoate deaminase
MIFAAGQTGIEPATGDLVPGGVEEQTRQVLTNLQNVIEAAGSSFKHVVRTTVFLRDMNDFAKMNAIYAEYFGENPPARSTIAVAGLPKNGLVEIEAIALIP